MLLFPAPFGFRLAIGPRNLPPSSSRLNRGYDTALSWRSKVVQIVEPAMRITDRPTVQLGLHLRYPPARPHRAFRRGVTIRWRIFRHYSLRPFSKTAAALGHVTGFPGLGLLRRLRPTRPVRRSMRLSPSDATGLPATEGV